LSGNSDHEIDVSSTKTIIRLKMSLYETPIKPDASQFQKRPLASISPVCDFIYRTRHFVLVILSIALTSTAQAFGGAALPWTTYEAEDMTTMGGATILGPLYGTNVVASESSGRKCVQLDATGESVEFTNRSPANAIVVRYSVPDTSSGGGTNYTLSLYTNGTFAQKLQLTSKYSWLYGTYGTGSPAWNNNPSAGRPRNFYDEVRTNGLVLDANVVVRLRKDSDDTATNYVIDLVDLEYVAALTQPANSLSITSSPYNAIGDGSSNCTAALQRCINDAAGSKIVWIPPGIYKITNAISLPSFTTIQGAGMWYSTLVGDPVLYNTVSTNRVTLNGTGNNIHLYDFAIVGKLNYRHDGEFNDGLGGSYGTGSSIARVWVEHTKTGAWLVNSKGLLVDSCRFRNTLADGINLCVGMQSALVTNCTARGTGDDCFAIWPATYLPQINYLPGSNVITRCTAQTPFLANGGAIYGSAGNGIEDCLFQDMTYGCGILISTTFPVGTNTFKGTTAAQRCDLIRCGGYDPGYQWRAALQLCLDTYSGGISGVYLKDLNITNSISDGMSIIGGNGTLSNAVAANVSIPDYGIGAGGRNGLWARSDAVGSMVVSNSAMIQYRDDSANFTFSFVTSGIPVSALVFVQQPGDVLQGAMLSPEVQVQAFNANGQSLADATISLSLGSGTGTLGGTLTRLTDAGGIAHFNDLTLSEAGPKMLLATALAGSAPPTNSGPFTVIGPAAALAFTTQPGSAVAGVPFGQQPVLKTVDAFGNPTTAGLPASLPVYIGLTNGTGHLLGTTNFNLGTGGSNGVAACSDLAIDVAGSGNQLVAWAGSSLITIPVSGMSLWLDGSVTASVLTNASGIVTNWLDQSGNGNHFNTTIGSGGNGIRYTNTLVNGRKSVTFSATSGTSATELKNTTYTSASKAISVFVVARKTQAGTAEGGYQHVFAAWAGGANPDYADAGSYSLDYNQNNNTPRVIRGCCSAYVDNNCPVMDPSTNFHAFEYVADGAGSNGIWLASSGSTMQGTGPLFGNVSANFNIVASTVGGGMVNGTTINNPFAGSVAEVLVYDRALNGADRASVGNYLRAKWFAPDSGPSISHAVSEPFTVLPGGSPPRQNILGITINGDASVALTYATTPGYTYHVEVTTNLLPAAWTTMAGSVTNASGTTASFTDPNPVGSSQRYYRTVSP
jgi:hypothetical protein